MGRKVAVVWHALFTIAAGVLYFYFVLPRWPELSFETSRTLGLVARIVTGALIGLAALPVVFTLLRTRRPELGTPKLALTLRIVSIVLHVLGGVLIVGTAISEIWLSLDDFGPWLFGIYGAAAAISLLGVLAFYLGFVAELPPPPPKPIKAKAKAEKRRRGRKEGKAEDDAADEATTELQKVSLTKADKAGDETDEVETPEGETVEVETPTEDDTVVAEPGGVRTRRPTGKIRRRRKSGGAAAEVETPADDKTNEVEKPADDTGAAEVETPADDKTEEVETPAGDDTVVAETARGGARNRRPTGRIRRRRKSGGVAVED